MLEWRWIELSWSHLRLIDTSQRDILSKLRKLRQPDHTCTTMWLLGVREKSENNLFKRDNLPILQWWIPCSNKPQAEKLDFEFWKGQYPYYPMKWSRFAEKKKSSEIQKFYKGQTPPDQQKVQKSNIILKGFRYPNFLNPFEYGKLFHDKSFPKITRLTYSCAHLRSTKERKFFLWRRRRREGKGGKYLERENDKSRRKTG